MRRMWAAGAAIVMCLALGGVPALAQSPVPTGVTPVASGSPAPMAAQVHGTVMCENVQDATTMSANGVDSFRDQVIRCTYTASDPRLNGTAVAHLAGDYYVDAGSVYWDTQVITGPAGTWVGGHYAADDPAGKVVMQGVFQGTGAYDGWTYIERLDPSTNRVDGFLYPGAPPPVVAPPEAAAAASPSPSPAPSLATIGQPADDGARIVTVETVDARTRDLTIESPSVGTVKVRLLLPSTFDAQPTTRFPVLYLLQGCCDSYDSWTRSTDVEALTAPTDLLVVMPAATSNYVDGWYTDWYNDGKGGPPKWETFHLTELRQLLERNWQAGDQRVIAGLSMGGYGAITYAARHPDLFKAAASYSGVLDLKVDPTDFSQPDDITRWGDPTTDAANWDQHDPIKLVPQLRGMPLYIAYGNGEPGPLDPTGRSNDDLEAWIGQGGDLFVAALKDAGISATVNAYGPGTHSWPYWERELHASLPMLLQALGESGVLPSPTPAPSVVAGGTAWVTGRNTCDYTDYPVARCAERASDPRVSGTATRTITLEPPTSDQGALMWDDVTLDGPEGTWTGEGYGVMESDATTHLVEIMSGSGAYQGLVYATWGTVDPNGNATYAGLIQQGTVPPGFPVGPAASPSPSTT